MQEISSNGWSDKKNMFPDMPIHEDGGQDVLKWYFQDDVKPKMKPLEKAVCIAYRDALIKNQSQEKINSLLKRFLQLQEKYPNLSVENI